MLYTLLACSSAHPLTPDSAAADDSGEPSTGAQRCTLDPVLEDGPMRLRVAGDGAVWIDDAGGILTRYTRADTDGCALVGARVPGYEDPFEAVTDLSVAADGSLWALVFLDELRRLDADGVAEVSCDVYASHTLAAGTNRVWVWAVGDTELHHANLDGDTCTAADGTLALDRPLDVVGRVEPDGLAAAAFDSSGVYPAGFVMDLETGGVVRNLGNGEDADGSELGGVWDLYVTTDGYAVVDGASLWWLDSTGDVLRSVDGHDLLGNDDFTALVSLDFAGGDQYYFATEQDVWLVDL